MKWVRREMEMEMVFPPTSLITWYSGPGTVRGPVGPGQQVAASSHRLFLRSHHRMRNLPYDTPILTNRPSETTGKRI